MLANRRRARASSRRSSTRVMPPASQPLATLSPATVRVPYCVVGACRAAHVCCVAIQTSARCCLARSSTPAAPRTRHSTLSSARAALSVPGMRALPLCALASGACDLLQLVGCCNVGPHDDSSPFAALPCSAAQSSAMVRAVPAASSPRTPTSCSTWSCLRPSPSRDPACVRRLCVRWENACANSTSATKRLTVVPHTHHVARVYSYGYHENSSL